MCPVGRMAVCDFVRRKVRKTKGELTGGHDELVNRNVLCTTVD